MEQVIPELDPRVHYAVTNLDELEFTFLENTDRELGTVTRLVLQITGSVRVLSRLSDGTFFPSFSKEPLRDIQSKLAEHPAIDGVTLERKKPFWRGKVPKNVDSIHTQFRASDGGSL